MNTPRRLLALALLGLLSLHPWSPGQLIAADNKSPKIGNELEATEVGSTELGNNQSALSKNENMK